MSEAAVNTLVSRAQWQAYMECLSDNALHLIGEGFTSLSESKNPKEYSRQYVHENSERTDVLGYSSSIAYSCDIYTNDPVISEIVEITDREIIGTAAQRNIISVNLWKQGKTDGTYEAFQRRYAIIPDTKGDGTEALIYSGNFKCVSPIVKGSFDPKTKEFTPDETV